jgi:acyl carrier protein
VDTKDISERLLTLLTGVAPDIDPASVVPDRNLRDQFDFDSMDTLHFATAISREFDIEVAEGAYAQLASLSRACNYVQRMLAARTAAIAGSGPLSGT